jgi:Cu(I)/Ag(I) efflux system membrane fusion protein
MKKLIYFIAVVFLMATGSSCSKSNSAKNETAQTEVKSSVSHAMLTVNGSCGMCKERIEKTAKGIDGVSTAEWDSETQKLHLHFDTAKTSLKTVSEALAKVGHDTDLDKASDEVYNALPDCCKYRK